MRRPAYLISTLLSMMALLCTVAPTAVSARTTEPSWTAALPARILIADIPMIYQRHALSCEAASLAMTVRESPSEAQIVAAMPRNEDPWLGFRGDIDGQESLANGLADYGIYAPPLAQAARAVGLDVRTFNGPHAKYLLEYAIGVLHRPVVVWLTYGLTSPHRIAGSAGTRRFSLFYPEHANAVVGYDATGVSVHDPLRGIDHYSWPAFLAVWQGSFNGMSLVADHHLTAPALQLLGAIRNGNKGVWTWTGALPGSQTRVDVLFDGHLSRTVTLPVIGTAGPQSIRLPLISGKKIALRLHESAPLAIDAPVLTTSALSLPAPQLTPTTTPTPSVTALPTSTGPTPTATPSLTPTATP